MDVVEIRRSDADAKDKREGVMINRRHLLMGIPAAALMTHQAGRALAQGVIAGSAPGAGKKSVMLMNCIGPSACELFIANPDGTDDESSWHSRYSTITRPIPLMASGSSSRRSAPVSAKRTSIALIRMVPDWSG